MALVDRYKKVLIMISKSTIGYKFKARQAVAQFKGGDTNTSV